MPETSSRAAQSDLFRGLGPEAVAEVLRASSARSLAPGESLFFQGDPVEALYVVESGALRLAQHTPDGEEVIVRTMVAGDIVAGVALFDRRIFFPVSAICQSACRVLLWPRARIQELAARHPQLRSNVMGAIAERMQDSFSRIRELSTESVAQRIARTLVRLARESGRSVPGGTLIDQPLGRQEIADLSGASMYTASRLLAGWAREGILDVGRQRVTIRSLDRLEKLAQGAEGG
jgi:CRP-like cAMP-binding protein